jgi:hypothetical protein
VSDDVPAADCSIIPSAKYPGMFTVSTTDVCDVYFIYF